MKYLLLLIFIVLIKQASAQTIIARLVDAETRQPMPYVFVASASGNVFSGEDGNFMLKITAPNDTIRIKTMGYKPIILPAANWGSYRRVLLITPHATQLGEVTIRAMRNHRKDSAALRQEFAKQFNFRGPRFNEIVTMPSKYMPIAGISINVGALFQAITKKSNPNYKLQQVLLRDERENHVSARFNKTLVRNVTSLKGDSLETFMTSYRPTAGTLDAFTDYDLIQYIKTNMAQFKLSSGKSSTLPVLLKPGQSLGE